MFVTLTGVDAIVVDLDGFASEPGLLNDLLKEIDGRFRVCAATAGSGLVPNFPHLDIFRAENGYERFYFENVLIKALLAVASSTHRTVFISGDHHHLNHAGKLLLGTILLTPNRILPIDALNRLPDFVLEEARQVPLALDGRHVGYIGEFLSYPENSRPFEAPQKVRGRFHTIAATREFPWETHVGGRYFGSSDPRHILHPHSLNLLYSKSKPDLHAPVFGRTLANILKLNVGKNFDYLTCVPPRPGKTNRLAAPMNKIRTFRAAKDIRFELKPNLVECVRSYAPMKTLTNQMKVAELESAFQLTEKVVGKSIVLIDDIRSSGSTLAEVARLLQSEGATEVATIALAYHPLSYSGFDYSIRDELTCSRCGCALLPKHNSLTGNAFFGCSKYYETGCKGSQTFKEGLTRVVTSLQGRMLKFD